MAKSSILVSFLCVYLFEFIAETKFNDAEKYQFCSGEWRLHSPNMKCIRLIEFRTGADSEIFEMEFLFKVLNSLLVVSC